MAAVPMAVDRQAEVLLLQVRHAVHAVLLPSVHAVLQIVRTAPLSPGSVTEMLPPAEKEAHLLVMTGMRRLVAIAVPQRVMNPVMKEALQLGKSVVRPLVPIDLRRPVAIGELRQETIGMARLAARLLEANGRPTAEASA
jgi:hypothetical protein